MYKKGQRILDRVWYDEKELKINGTGEEHNDNWTSN